MNVRDYISGDEFKIIELFKIVFKKNFDEKYWKWRFLENIENMLMIKLVFDKDLLVGHYAVSPFYMAAGGKKILAALSITTMTHPQYKGKGIFKKIARDLYSSQYENNKLVIVYGFPNSNSHYGFIKNLGWENISQIPVFKLIVDHFLMKNYYSSIVIVDNFTCKHELAYSKITEKYDLKILKTKKYLEWRYIYNPINRYTIFSLAEDEKTDWYVVTKIYQIDKCQDVYDVDILELIIPDDEKIINDFIFSIINFYKKYKLCSINCWVPLDDNKHILMEKVGFFPSGPVTYFSFKRIDSGFSISNANLWYYSMGDSDVY